MHAELIGLGLFAAAAIAGAYLIWRALSPRVTPEELERRRRLAVNAIGKIIDGEITGIEGAAVIYSYSVAGVEYTAAQDLFRLENLVPSNQNAILGVALVKYDPRNPANSIVVCEKWTGLPGNRNRPDDSGETVPAS
jgi:hypothetical protein